jgi:ketosteroid isomerase-like protein
MDRTSDSQPVAQPKEVFEQLRERVFRFDAQAQADLFAADVVVEFPFAPDGFPRRIEGCSAFVAALQPMMDLAKSYGHQIEGYESQVVHETLDPEVIVAEFEVVGRISGDGETFRLPYVQRLRVRNGQIIAFRDYWPPQTAAVAATSLTSGHSVEHHDRAE